MNRFQALLLALVCSLVLPATAQQKPWLKNTTTKRARAVGIATSLACFTIKGRLTEDQSHSRLIFSLKRDEIYEIMKYLQSANGTKAIQITSKYLNKASILSVEWIINAIETSITWQGWIHLLSPGIDASCHVGCQDSMLSKQLNGFR